MLTSRRLGFAAVVGGGVGLLYWPLHSLAYFATEDGSEGLLKWADSGRNALEPLLDWASADTVYVTYGKVTLVVVLGFLAGLLALRPAGRVARWGRRLAIAGAAIGVVGILVEYGLAAVEEGFLITAPAMLLLLVGSTLLGAGLLREEAPSQAGAWLLALSIPLLFGTTALLGHLSAGLVPLDLAWILIGRRLTGSGAAFDAERVVDRA